MNTIYRDSVVATWSQDADFPSVDEFDVAANLLDQFYNTYPKYNILNGARNGCNFKAHGNGSFNGFFLGNRSDFTFENFENQFHECVWQSYFVNYEEYQNANSEYLGIVRSVDVPGNPDRESEHFDATDFSFIENFVQELVDSFNPTYSADDLEQAKGNQSAVNTGIFFTPTFFFFLHQNF